MADEIRLGRRGFVWHELMSIPGAKKRPGNVRAREPMRVSSKYPTVP
jgi:hypothetical protein